MRIQTSRQSSQIKPSPRVEAILFDILKAIQEAYGGKDARSLQLFFDEESIRILSSDEKLLKLIRELISLIQIIQSLRQKGQPEEILVRSISGKGKPYWQVTDVCVNI